MTKINLKVFAGVLGLCLASTVQAGEGSGRMKHPLGFYGSLAGDPYISLLGISLGWNLMSNLRVTAGYGSTPLGIINGTTWGGGLKWLISDSSFTPVLGLNYSQFKGDFLGLVAIDAVNIVYVNAGFDWQADVGFNFGIGVNKAINQSSTLIPYLSLGWFF